MQPVKFTKQLLALLETAQQLVRGAEADALLVMLDGPAEWERLRFGELKTIVAAATEEELAGAKDAGLFPVVLGNDPIPISEKLTQAVLESVADDVLSSGARVVALYSAFEPGQIDTVSVLRLDEHLGRLTARDLRALETSVPLDTLKTVVDLAVDIGREGREGKPVGTMFVIGDTRKVLALCHGFNPVKGYGRRDRDLNDSRTRELVKELAQLDGAFVVSPDGTLEKASQIIDAVHTELTLAKGLGARHWAAAAVSKQTRAIAVVVSESNGTVRIFRDGEVVLRIEPFLRRAMKWKDFDVDAPTTSPE